MLHELKSMVLISFLKNPKGFGRFSMILSRKSPGKKSGKHKKIKKLLKAKRLRKFL